MTYSRFCEHYNIDSSSQTAKDMWRQYQVTQRGAKRMSLEEKLQKGYEEYLKLPKATHDNWKDVELYKNHWFSSAGRSLTPPHPQEYYTFTQFTYYCGKKQDLYDRFIAPYDEKLPEAFFLLT
jgi:hypothetical protein